MLLRPAALVACLISVGGVAAEEGPRIPAGTAPANDRPDGRDAILDCASTLRIVAEWAREQGTKGNSFVECKGSPSVLSVADERLVSLDEARRVCAADWCFWTVYEPKSGTKMTSTMQPARDKAGFFWEHVRTVRFSSGVSRRWVLELEPSISISDGVYLPPTPRPPEDDPGQRSAAPGRDAR